MHINNIRLTFEIFVLGPEPGLDPLDAEATLAPQLASCEMNIYWFMLTPRRTKVL